MCALMRAGVYVCGMKGVIFSCGTPSNFLPEVCSVLGDCEQAP